MAERRNCPICGAEFTANFPEGLCPKCLLNAGLEHSQGEESSADAPTAGFAHGRSGAMLPGTKVSYLGDYELLGEIARGGMGVVYRAKQISLSRTVAVKMILAGELATEEEVTRFYSEAESAANLQHPNIVPIYEVGEHDGQHYFSMEFVEGQSLADIARDRPLSVKKSVEYVKTIAEAIHYAHERGTLHRDLKPSNILIDQADKPRITDFGLAKRMAGDVQLTATGAALGTPSYMPPEQAAGKRGLVGPASDVYSLGAVLYKLLTARPPFQGETAVDTVLQVMDTDPVSPRDLNPNVPDDLATICLKCLEKRPEQRYRTAQELAQDLGRFLDHEPILARPAGSVRKAWSWTRRRPWTITAIFSLCLAGLLGLVYWLWAENSYLRFAVQHPDYVKEAGPRTAILEQVRSFGVMIWGGLLWATLSFQKHCGTRRRRGLSVSQRLIAPLAAFGAAGVIFGMCAGMLTIDAHVWENRSVWPGFLHALVGCYWGVFALVLAVRELERMTFGSAVDISKLTDDQRSELQRIILSIGGAASSSKIIKAIQLYREVTGASLRDAKNAVEEIQAELHLLHPDLVPAVRDPQERALAIIGGFFKGVLALLLLLLTPFLVLSPIQLAAEGQPQWLIGMIALFFAVAATVSYRRNHNRFTRVQLVLLCLLLVGLASLAIVLPPDAVLVGSLFGSAMGIVTAFLIPASRLAYSPIQGANWKHGLIKAITVAVIVGFVTGFIPVVTSIAFGTMTFDIKGCTIFFVTIPTLSAMIWAVAALPAVGILHYFRWTFGRRLTVGAIDASSSPKKTPAELSASE